MILSIDTVKALTNSFIKKTLNKLRMQENFNIMKAIYKKPHTLYNTGERLKAFPQDQQEDKNGCSHYFS